MRLTRFGIKGALFYLAMVGAFFASPYSNLFFLLLGFLTVQWLACALATARNLGGVRASVAEVEPAPAGRGWSAPARVLAPGRARFQVVVELELAGSERAAGQAEVVEGEARVDVAVPALPRGVYAVRGARASTTYPFGLFERRRPIEAPAELVVYPAPAALADARGGSRTIADALGGAAGAGGAQPAWLRDHREGDEPRSVHWRATARRGALVVAERESGSGEGIELCIDRRCAPGELEEALSLASAIVAAARADEEPLALHSQDLRATFGPGHRPWREALRFLAAAGVVPADGPPPPPVAPTVIRLPLAPRAAAALPRPAPAPPPPLSGVDRAR